MSGVIPERVVELLHGATIMQIGTRDAQLRPAHAWGTGAVAHPDGETVTVFIPANRQERILGDLRDNGRIAMGVALVSHEAYQLKGTYLSARATEEADIVLQEAHMARMLAALRQVYPDEIAKPMVLGFKYRPGIAISFRVDEVFRQTPGPGAGEKMA
jgi:hypothetical protein